MSKERIKREISNWVRQGRHRAKKYLLVGDVQIQDVEKTIERLHGKCAYCGAPYEHLDCIFPLKSQAPFVSSNITLICSSCKDKKGNDDILMLLRSGKITNDKYVQFIEDIIASKDDRMIQYIRSITGITNE